MPVQWQYQARPPGLLDGVALPFTKETLRALQDALPLHQALRSKYAQIVAMARLCQPHGQIFLRQHAAVDESVAGYAGLVWSLAVRYEECMEYVVLVQR